MISIARAVNGISINGREFLLDDSGNKMRFETEEKAKVFLIEHGISEDIVDDFDFIDEDEV